MLGGMHKKETNHLAADIDEQEQKAVLKALLGTVVHFFGLCSQIYLYRTVRGELFK
jgi:hypothetical protein